MRGTPMARPRMITAFHATGASAGSAKWWYVFRIPTTIPESPSRTTIGKSTRDRPTARSKSPPGSPKKEADTIPRTSPSPRDTAVAIEKTAGERASRRPCSLEPATGRSSGISEGGATTADSPSECCYHRHARVQRAFSRHGEHQATEEARAHPGPAAAREPALPLDHQDAHESPPNPSRPPP